MNTGRHELVEGTVLVMRDGVRLLSARFHPDELLAAGWPSARGGEWRTRPLSDEASGVYPVGADAETASSKLPVLA